MTTVQKCGSYMVRHLEFWKKNGITPLIGQMIKRKMEMEATRKNPRKKGSGIPAKKYLFSTMGRLPRGGVSLAYNSHYFCFQLI